MAAAAVGGGEFFDLYYLPIDSKIDLVMVFDQYRSECYLGLHKAGKQIIISAPMNAFQDIVREINEKAVVSKGKLTYYDDRFGLNVTCKPDIHSKRDFECVTITQPITRMEVAIGSVFGKRPGYKERKMHQMTMSLASYNRFEGDLDFATKLFRVLRLSKHPDQRSDENTIQREFIMCLKPRSQALEFRMSITPRRFTGCNEPAIEIVQEKVVVPGQLGVPEASFRFGVEYIKQCENFHGREIRLQGYGQLILRDNVGNNLQPIFVVYPKVGELPVDCWPKSVEKAICFTFNEWIYFVYLIDVFKAWYKSTNGFYGTGW